MKLFYTKRSPYARKARIIALEKKINLEFVDEDLTNKSAALLKANPVGKVPTLWIDDQSVLCDSPLICEYLDSLNTAPRFIPQDPAQRIKVLNMAAIADGMMDITITAYMEKIRHPQDFNQKLVDNSYAAIERLLGYFEGQVADLKSWHLGSVGVVCALGYLQFRLGELYRAQKYPQLDRWYQDVATRPSLQGTIPVA
jgi:glutathione S-transferase